MGERDPRSGETGMSRAGPSEAEREGSHGWVGRWDRDLRGWAGRGGVRRTLNVWYLFFLQLVEILMFTV